MGRRTWLLLVVSACCVACAGASRPDVQGDWAGWGYLDEGGDLPLRLHLRSGEDGALSATLDSPAQKAFELPVRHAVWEGPDLRLERETSSGAPLVLDAVVEGDTMHGRMDFAGSPGRFEMVRSALPLPVVDPESYAGCTGTYRLASGNVLIVGRRFWGELLLTDLDSGRFVTLFPESSQEFFAGPAMYVPRPVKARARFERDAGGEVVALHWQDEGAEPQRADRLRFVEEPASFTRDGVSFAGTVIRPDGPGPFPGIVVLGGSNWDVRGSIRRDAEIYAALGLAALIYDKRGHGESGGEPTVPFETTARDALAGWSWLAGRSYVRRERVGLAGTSRGGWIAPLAASLSPDVDFLVLFVAPAVSPAEQETTRRLNLLRGEGRDEATLALAADALAETWRFARSGEDFERYLAARGRAVAGGVPASMLETDDPDPEAWRWMRLNMHYDPLPALRRVRVPVLAVFGAEDHNVVPEINLPLMREALAQAGNHDAELIVLPGADHGLRLVPPGQALPLHRSAGFAPGRWTAVREWLAR